MEFSALPQARFRIELRPAALKKREAQIATFRPGNETPARTGDQP
jgi:hypothetical protein